MTTAPVYQQLDLPENQWVSAWTDWIIKDGQKIGHATHPAIAGGSRRFLPCHLSTSNTARLGLK